MQNSLKNMNEHTLLKISIISALIGIFILYIVSENIKIDDIDISKIKKEQIGSDVKIKGVVKSAFNGKKASIITITKNEEMKIVIMNENNKKNISLKEGDYIEVIGEINEYEGELEVMGERIRVIN